MPLGVAVDGANRHDMKLFLETLLSIPVERPQPSAEHPQNVCLDSGYDYDVIYDQAVSLGLVPHIRPNAGCIGNAASKARRQQKEVEGSRTHEEAADRKARRWVVERLHSWLNRYRHLLVRWAKKPENYLAMIHLAFAHILFKQARNT